MIRVELADTPYHTMPFLNAAGGKGGAVRELLPFLEGRISGLPAGSLPVVATGDLQGRSALGSDPATLLGCRVAAELPEIQTQAGLPAPARCIGLLAGDLYTVPNAAKRGGTGDVTQVWNDMRSRFAGLAGVLGNHDIFGEAAKPRRSPDDCLDGWVVETGGLRIGGVSGIVGSPGRTNRRSPDKYEDVLLNVLADTPHILVLHAAPRSDDGAPGEAVISAAVKSFDFRGLIVCGHVHWRSRVQQCGNAVCLNVDGAVVTLRIDEGKTSATDS